jgi:hypothetical protein
MGFSAISPTPKPSQIAATSRPLSFVFLCGKAVLCLFRGEKLSMPSQSITINLRSRATIRANSSRQYLALTPQRHPRNNASSTSLSANNCTRSTFRSSSSFIYTPDGLRY